MAERDRLQPRKLVAAAGAAEENRQMVADEPATEAGEDRRPAGKARPLLLAAAGRESSDAPPLRVDGTADRVAALASGLVNHRPNRIMCPEEKTGGNVSKASVERGAVSDFDILRSSKRGGFRWRRRLRTAKTRLTLAFRGGQAYGVAGSESIMEIPV